MNSKRSGQQPHVCDTFFSWAFSFILGGGLEAAFVRAQIDALTTFINPDSSIISRKKHLGSLSPSQLYDLMASCVGSYYGVTRTSKEGAKHRPTRRTEHDGAVLLHAGRPVSPPDTLHLAQ